MTGQRAAQRKNSPRQWGRPFGRAPREICPAISTHPHLGRGLHHHVEVEGRWCSHLDARTGDRIVSDTTQFSRPFSR